MLTKKTLHEIQHMRRECEYLRDRIARLRHLVESVPPEMEAHPFDDLLAEIVQKTLRLERKLQYIEREIEALPHPARLILQLKYCQGLSWREVAKRSHYSERQCYRIVKKYLT